MEDAEGKGRAGGVAPPCWRLVEVGSCVGEGVGHCGLGATEGEGNVATPEINISGA